MKKIICAFFTLFVLFILSACGSLNHPTTMPSATKEPTTIPIKIIDKAYNPYNCCTATDGKNIFGAQLDGIYKFEGEKKIKMADGDDGAFVRGLTIIDNAVFWVEVTEIRDKESNEGSKLESKLKKMDLETNKISELSTNIDFSGFIQITSFHGALYIVINEGVYRAYPEDDLRLNFQKVPSLPAGNGWFYYSSEIDDEENKMLPRFNICASQDFEKQNEITLAQETDTPNFIVTNAYIFYIFEQNLYKMKLDGTSKELVMKQFGGSGNRLLNFNDSHLFVYVNELEESGGDKLLQINQTNNDIVQYSFPRYSANFDFVGDSFWSYENGQLKSFLLSQFQLA
jgi:hypothetical protein